MRCAAPVPDARTVSRARTRGRAGSADGFTLVELVITMLLISIAALGVTYVLGLAFRHQSDALWQAKAVALASAYAEEILSRRFDEHSPQGGVPPCSPATTPCSLSSAFNDGEPRAQFDDIDDYDGVSDSPPLDADGNPRTDYAAYRVDVAVAYADSSTIAKLGLNGATDVKVVTVQVTSPEGGRLTLAALKGNY